MGRFSAKGVRLTDGQVRDLQSAARHPDGVFRVDGARGLRRTSKERSAAKLVSLGLIEPSPHGDFYVTTAGRSRAEGASDV